MLSDDDSLALLRRLLAESPFDDIAEQIMPLARFGLCAELADGEPAIGASKIGGLPDLPAGTRWPEYRWLSGRTEPLWFLAQFRLSELDQTLWEGPQSGLLSLFYRAPEDEDREPACGFLFAADVALERRSPPDDLDKSYVFEQSAVTFARTLTIPSIGTNPSLALSGLGFEFGGPRSELVEDYSELLWDLQNEQNLGGGTHLLGWPMLIRDDVVEQWILDDRAVSGNDSASSDTVEEEARQWTLLLSINGPHETQISLGVPTADLRAGAFDRVRGASQW